MWQRLNVQVIGTQFYFKNIKKSIDKRKRSWYNIVTRLMVRSRLEQACRIGVEIREGTDAWDYLIRDEDHPDSVEKVAKFINSEIVVDLKYYVEHLP